MTEDGRSICVICNKIFSKPSQLRLHVNIHYFERPFRCESCAVSFRTKGHLQKHERSVSHQNKVRYSFILDRRFNMLCLLTTRWVGRGMESLVRWSEGNWIIQKSQLTGKLTK